MSNLRISTQRARARVRRLFEKRQPAIEPILAATGGGPPESPVEVADRPGYIYVRSGDIVYQVYNDHVPEVEGQLVWIGRDPMDTKTGALKVLGRSSYNVGGQQVPPVRIHAPEHNKDGYDPAYLDTSQILPLRVGPYQGKTVQVIGGVAEINGNRLFIETQTLDLTTYSATGNYGENAKWVLIYVQQLGTISAVAGDQFVNTPPYDPADAPATPANTLPLALVLMISGHQTLRDTPTRTDFADIRFFRRDPATSSGVIVHNDTSGLQGGTTDEYYHLTAAEHTDLGDMMKKSVYDTDDDGIVDEAETAALAALAADLDIDAMTEELTPASGDMLVLSRAGTRKKVNVDNLPGGGGAVDSVNGQTGTVVLDPDDLDDSATTNKFTTQTEIDKLAGIESGADVTDATNIQAAFETIPLMQPPGGSYPDDNDEFIFQQVTSDEPRVVTLSKARLNVVRSVFQSTFDTLYEPADTAIQAHLANSAIHVVTGTPFGTLVGNGNFTTIAAGTTMRYGFGFLGNTSNASVLTIMRPGVPCRLFYFQIYIGSAQPGTGSLDVNLYTGASVAVTISIPAGSAAGWYSELITAANVSANTGIRVQITNNASGASASIGSFSIGQYAQ